MWFIPGLVIVCMNIYVIYKIFQSKRQPIGKKKVSGVTSFRYSNGLSNPTPPNELLLQQQHSSPKRIFYKSNMNSNVDDKEKVRLYLNQAAMAAHKSSSSVSLSDYHQAQLQLSPNQTTVNIYLNKVKFYFLCFMRVPNSDSITVKSQGGADEFYARNNSGSNKNKVLVDDYNMVNFTARQHGGGLVGIGDMQPSTPPPCDDSLRPNVRKCSIDDYILNKHFNRTVNSMIFQILN